MGGLLQILLCFSPLYNSFYKFWVFSGSRGHLGPRDRPPGR